MTLLKLNRIAQLNDQLRTTLQGGEILLSRNVHELPEDEKLQVTNKVKSFNDFDVEDDPYGEHDFGAFEHNGERYFFKIDYYDKTLKFGSDDPANPDKTARVLTILTAMEY